MILILQIVYLKVNQIVNTVYRLYSGNVKIEKSKFEGFRALKMHDSSNFSGNVVINSNIFDSIKSKPGIVVGDVSPNSTTLKIINNEFINANIPGDQENYTYESDTMGPTEYRNNIVNGVVENELKNTTSYDEWLIRQA